jgi:D-hydroxyproline dehydrogenase subunit beta
MTGDGYDLAVVGAGIVGLGHAAAARERGLRVVVVDRAAAIQGSTVRNFGHVGVSVHAGEAGEYAARSRELWLRLAERAGFWIRAAGTLVVARAEDELAVLEESGVGALLTAAQVAERAPVRGALGGMHRPDDLQVDPREAGPAIAAHLAAEGVEFRWRTAAVGAEPGILHTTRGPIRAEAIVVAVNHDVDQLYPAIAEEHGIERCGLDMLLADGVGLGLPVLTGSSMLRYGAFASTPSAPALRARIAAERPELLARDVNQMYTERPDGTLVIGDTHYRGAAVPPFQDEGAFRLLLGLAAELFGREIAVRQRWQGVYATAPREFLRAAPADGVRVVAVTTGIGMTTGLGLAASVIEELRGAGA